MVGYSNECSISLQSGQTIFNNINRNIFNPFKIFLRPCTWCNFHQSALTINKNLCKIFLNSFGINTAPSLLLYNNIKLSIEKIIKKVTMYCKT
ncbi:MAG: hypothetical protein NHF94_01140 [Candidatus Bostrichicola ureolyticus]|nr:MAG: hypothetical protein NHF94_01140 [Candidatus Bostrichicola ureolyticus]